MSYIVDWTGIVENNGYYIVFPINGHLDGHLYLGSRPEVMLGWQVKRLRQGCYAALPKPTFDPVIMETLPCV